MTVAATSPADLDARDRAQPPAAEPAGTGLRLMRLRLLRGCNLYHRRSVMTLQAELGRWAGRTTAGLAADFAARFVERFDFPTRSIQSPALDPGFVASLRSPAGVPLEAALLAAVLATEAFTLDHMLHLERIRFSRFFRHQRRPRALLVWETLSPSMSPRSAAVAFAGCVDLLEPANGLRFQARVDSLRRRAQQRAVHYSTAVVKLAASERDLPCEVFGDHLRLGEGARQQAVYRAVTAGTSLDSARHARDKRATLRRMEQSGLPVPRQCLVRDVESALAAVDDVGLPAVIKPRRGNTSRGVTAGVSTAAEIRDAFERASSQGQGSVLVEAFVPGVAHRLLVVGGRFVAAARRLPPQVTGDGRRSVRELIDAVNAELRRDSLRAFPITYDPALTDWLRHQGCELETILEVGRTITLRSTSDLFSGGVSIDVTTEVHRHNRRLAERAARTMGLDIAGVDFVTTDIARSSRRSDGKIIEVNASPGLGSHVFPYEGESQPVGAAILDAAFPAGATPTIPTVVVIGDRRTAAVARATERRLRKTGTVAGLLLRDSAKLNGSPIEFVRGKSNRAIRTLLRDPTIEALVCAMSPWTIVGRGLTLERCDVAAILPPRHEAPSNTFLAGLEVLKAATRGSFVVRADDPVARTLLADIEPRRLVLVAPNADDADARRHLADGGRAVLKTWHKDGPKMTLVDGGRTLAAAPLKGDVRGARTLAPLFALALAHAVRGHEPRAAGVHRDRRVQPPA